MRAIVGIVIMLIINLLFNGCSSKISKSPAYIASKNDCKVWSDYSKEIELLTWDGKCVNGYAEGKGKLFIKNKKKNTCVTICNLKKGKREGFATHTCSSGYKYIGNYSNNQRNGQGTSYDKDGAVYVGNWKNNKRDGQGIFFKQDSFYAKGIFENGKLKNAIGYIWSKDRGNRIAVYKYKDGDKLLDGQFVIPLLSCQDISEKNTTKIESFLKNRTLIARTKRSAFSGILDAIYFDNDGFAYYRQTSLHDLSIDYQRNKWFLTGNTGFSNSTVGMICLKPSSGSSADFSPTWYNRNINKSLRSCSNIVIMDNTNALFEWITWKFGYPDRHKASWHDVRMEEGDSLNLKYNYRKSRDELEEYSKMIERGSKALKSFIGESLRNSANNSSTYDSSSSSNNCTEVENQCKNNCSSMSNKHGRECRSKCRDAYYSCKRGDTKEMSRNICKSQCVTKAGGSALDLQYSERIKCFRGCK